MAGAYSLDLRTRVVAAVEAGRTCRAVAETFGVSVASVVKWSQRHRATGSAAARPMGGRRHDVLGSERDWLLGRIETQPDVTVRELAAELAERGIKVSHVSVWNLLRRESQTFKKKPARLRAGST
jgi:transposase